MRKIPLIPICHAGLEVRDLPMPLSLRQGIAVADAEGLQRLYGRIAEVRKCRLPSIRFADLATDLGRAHDTHEQDSPALHQLEVDRAVRHRLEQALNHPEYEWRTIESVAIEAGISEEDASDLLRSDERVRFSINKKKSHSWADFARWLTSLSLFDQFPRSPKKVLKSGRPPVPE